MSQHCITRTTLMSSTRCRHPNHELCHAPLSELKDLDDPSNEYVMSLTIFGGPFNVLNEDYHVVRCAFSDRNLHSRMSLDPPHVRFKRTCV
jgi:hypothetical protein